MNDQPLQAGLTILYAQAAGDADKLGLICAKCRALLRGYHKRWSAFNPTPTSVESVGHVRLRNPQTNRQSRDLSVAGKLDVVALDDGRTVLMDHKTTSDAIEDPAGTYWQQLQVESQPTHYMLLEWMNGNKIDTATWDVVRKPSIAPRKLKSKAERALVAANRQYCNTNLSDAAMAWIAEHDTENMEMYEWRLLHDCCIERPAYYFARRSVPRFDSELIEYAESLWEMGQLLLAARKNDRWPKHSGSCMNYGSPCRYLGICSGQDTPESQNWQARPEVHAELGDVFDRNTLTYSSIRCFQTCPRKFYYRYELGIQRKDEQEREPLLFGHTWHLALEAYWKALLPTEESHGDRIALEESSVPF